MNTSPSATPNPPQRPAAHATSQWRRLVLYGAVLLFLAVAYFGFVALLQTLSQILTGPQSNLLIVVITLALAAFFNPIRDRFQALIDRRFYREKVDFRQAFTDFAREVRTIIDLQELLRALVTRTTDLFHSAHGAVFLTTEDVSSDNKYEFKLAEDRNLPSDQTALKVTADFMQILEGGAPVSRPNHNTFPLLIPLIAPIRTTGAVVSPQLIGVLALGPRLSEQEYSSEDQTLLTNLADQAGTAIYVAQLIQEKQSEAKLREESDRRLEAYRKSPQGRAESFAQTLLSDPSPPAFQFHAIIHQNDMDADLLDSLPRAFETLNAPELAGLADGYRYLYLGQTAPELLALGLRQLTQYSGDPATESIYQLCQRALDSNSIPTIVERGMEIKEANFLEELFFQPLIHGLRELATAAEALHAYERVDTSQDKLAYLASAVERLSHVDRLARTELSSADRPIIQRIADNWLAVVTGTMSELQTRARLVAHLLTRHTWTGDVITLALAVNNEGRGAALNLKVALTSAPEYTLVDDSATLDRLAAGEEAQLELRVRPRLAAGTAQFRARFVILYEDPRGPDQVENFADVVYLLTDEGEFKFIPNPYVVGTPLQTGSSLFFGRDDIFSFIQENLEAAHQNNLVLIGQRRTGKTSLLKQLPARLGTNYVSVYLDGQSLALDPGLPNFFFSLATEIAFALDDQHLTLEPPDLSDFADSPALNFERKFLTNVRTAIGDRHLLLLLDEFEELETAVRRGNLDSSIFGFLRHLIQHTTNLSVIFCGTHRMEELAADYWSVLFNISLYRHVAFLDQTEAQRLIQEPVAAFGMKYDDLALEKMWRVTAGHPYFLQLLCHSLVNQHNKSQRNYITVADVNAALDDILASGEAHFVFMWTESTRDERLVLTALSRMMPLTGQATPVQIADYLAARGISLDRRAVADSLHHLTLRDLLRPHDQSLAASGDLSLDLESYRWQLGLLGLWVEKYKSLSRVVDERN